jgi:putative transcriptional regulator
MISFIGKFLRDQNLAFSNQKLNLRNLKLLFYMKQHRNQNPQAGHLLLSAPFLQDDNFSRSVILLCEHEEGVGSVGFVMNKPSILSLGDLVSELDFLDVEVFVGGPVEQNTLHFVYLGDQLMEESKPLGNGVWWGGDFSALIEHISSRKLNLSQVRFFIGYSGWSSGQLAAELSAESWIVFSDPWSKELFDNSPDQLWRSLMKSKGGDFEIQSNYPIDPRLN